MIRDGDTWREATWDEAFARCEELIHGVRRAPRHRRDDRVHRQPGRPQLLARPLRARCSSGQSGMPAHLLVGHRRPVAEERLVASSCTGTCGRSRRPTSSAPTTGSCMGGNPQASGGSLLACPDVLGEIDAHPGARRQGRRHRPAPHRHRRPRRRVGPDPCPAPTPRSCSRCATCSSPRASSTSARSPTWSTASTSVRDARAPSSRPSRSRRSAGSRPRPSAASPASSPPRRAGAVYGRIGLCNQEFGTLASWLVDVVNILTGNFDRRRRPDVRQARSPWPLAWMARHAKVTACRRSAGGQSRVRGVPEVLGQVPASCLAEEIATPGDGPDQGARSPSPATRSSACPTRRASRRRCRARVHDQRRQLPQRDHALRPRDPARAVAARAAALRRAASGAGPARSGAKWSDPRLPAVADRPARVGDPRPARAGAAPAGRTTDFDFDAARRRLVRRALPHRNGLDAEPTSSRCTTTAGPSA